MKTRVPNLKPEIGDAASTHGVLAFLLAIACTTAAFAQYQVPWHTVDGGGKMSNTGGSFSVSGTIGQPDAQVAPVMSGGGFEVVGGFWGVTSGTGVPATTLTAAVSRKPNAAGSGGVCDIPLIPSGKSEMREGGMTEVRFTFDVPPGGPGPNLVSIEEATCAAPTYIPYSGSSTQSASVAGNDLVLIFTPGLENARTYKFTINSSVTSIAGQFVEVSGLIGDVNSDGLVNATDRSAVVGAWTGSGFSCATDVNNDSTTNALDRSMVVGAWTNPTANCAP